jgi:hypothetical protein
MNMRIAPVLGPLLKGSRMSLQQSEASLQPRPRKGCFRAPLQLPLMVSKKEDAGDDEANRREHQQQADGPGHAFHLRTEQVGASAEQCRPTNSAEGVHDQEMRPAHAVYTREKSGVGPEKGDEPAEEDNLPAVAQKQILAHLEPRLIESDVSAVSDDQADPKERPIR